MLWYEHLLGILAIAACINGLIIMAAIRVGAASDARLEAYTELLGHSAETPKYSTTKINQSLSKIAVLPLLKH